MQYVIDDAKQLLPGLWVADVPPRHLAWLPRESHAPSEHSVVVAPVFHSGNELRFDADAATLLVMGTSLSTLFLSSGSSLSEHSEGAASEGAAVPVTWRRDSDAGFLQACEELVGDEFRALGQALVDGFRSSHPGRLLEGKSRKWTNQPSNFVAITIQNRDRSFAISIRDVPEAKDSRLGPKPDRPGYLRFKLSGRSDLPEAFRLILASARRARPA
jgi:hypothetical protein